MEHSLIRPLSQSITLRCATRQSSRNPTGFVRYKSTISEGSSKQTLTWPEYLAIRGGRRKWQTAVTIPCALLGFVGGSLYFGSLQTDATKPIMGLDPFFFYGACTVGCVGAGFLIGPTLGSAVWRVIHRNNIKLIDARDREFYQHIAKNRVDPSLQSPTNPVPDYYGEKIGSIQQYRQWIRDQSKYRRKALLPEE